MVEEERRSQIGRGGRELRSDQCTAVCVPFIVEYDRLRTVDSVRSRSNLVECSDEILPLHLCLSGNVAKHFAGVLCVLDDDWASDARHTHGSVTSFTHHLAAQLYDFAA